MKNKMNARWALVAYDAGILILVDLVLGTLYISFLQMDMDGFLLHSAVAFLAVFMTRFSGNIYRQIWRYGGVQGYIRLCFTDGVAFAVYLAVMSVLSIFCVVEKTIYVCILSVVCINMIISMAMRMVYCYAYRYGGQESNSGRFLSTLLRIFSGVEKMQSGKDDIQKVKIAIIGAGRVGVTLAEELIANPAAYYIPRCFVDLSEEKAVRSVNGIPVFQENPETIASLKKHEVQEVVFAIPDLKENERKKLYELYSQAGYKVKVYDYPVMRSAGGKRQLRDFDIEELLFRKPVTMSDEITDAYYKDKTVLIAGGGGSIGAELCRQLAPMHPKRIIVLDIYENGVYDVQQDLKMLYGAAVEVLVEIGSITNPKAMARVFEMHHPDIVINAAAHKHVPLMEHNCIEAVENNVFGTKNLVELCEQYGTQCFMMVSTDKAVNPVNVMGATKRVCEMIVQSASTWGNVKYSATRFGNVLGSAGSVIPLFKRQIANGGPVTITDKRIIRYFMTIPEASQLVLKAGAMAKNGELFVLDMGQPVRILDLAETMIRMSGVSGVEIVETGLRPGEKLYEELLMKTETLTKTDNELIYIEKDSPLEKAELYAKLEILKAACETNDEEKVYAALKQVVPTFKAPEELNVEVKGGNGEAVIV